MSEETIKEESEYSPQESEIFCPACHGVGKKVKLRFVETKLQMAENPAQLEGAPRLVECPNGCRFTLEPYFKKKKKVLFCYVCILSDTNPGATCNHHWIHPGYVEGWDESMRVTQDGYYSPLKREE